MPHTNPKGHWPLGFGKDFKGILPYMVDVGLLSYMSTISVKIITSAMLTQLYGSLLNACTFLVIHKVKYCMVLSDIVWMHRLTILRYTWQKRKQHSFPFLQYTDSCRPTCIRHNQGLGLSSKASARSYLSFIFIRTKNDKFLTKQAHFHFVSLEHLKKKEE